MRFHIEYVENKLYSMTRSSRKEPNTIFKWRIVIWIVRAATVEWNIHKSYICKYICVHIWIYFPYLLMEPVERTTSCLHPPSLQSCLFSANMKPLWHEHVYEPNVFLQSCWQPPLFTAHSSLSTILNVQCDQIMCEVWNIHLKFGLNMQLCLKSQFVYIRNLYNKLLRSQIFGRWYRKWKSAVGRSLRLWLSGVVASHKKLHVFSIYCAPGYQGRRFLAPVYALDFQFPFYCGQRGCRIRIPKMILFSCQVKSRVNKVNCSRSTLFNW